MSAGIVVRRATSSDGARMPEVEQSAGEVFREIPELAWVADAGVATPATHRATIRNNPVWVAENAGTIVAFLTSTLYTDALHIAEVSVRRDWHRRGIGRQLIANLEDDARRLARPSLTLTTFRHVPWNAPYYRQLGFRIDHNPLARLTTLLDAEASRGFARDSRCAMRKSVR